MRKLLLSVCVIAVSAGYVAKNAASQPGGVQALLDRLTLRPVGTLPPLDLDDPLLAPALSDPAPGRAPAR